MIGITKLIIICHINCGEVMMEDGLVKRIIADRRRLTSVTEFDREGISIKGKLFLVFTKH